jgi:hypothetical protein
MTANSRINIERLTLNDKAELQEISGEFYALSERVVALRDQFQGKLHTRLDKVLCAIDDANLAIELV